MYVALAIAAVVYVAISLGVFGTLTVQEVIASGGTAIAEAAKPVLGEAGYWLMAVTALFATAGATNAGIYPASGLSRDLAAKGQFPPILGREWRGVPAGIAIMVVSTVLLVLAFDLSAIASLGSAVALLIFTLITVAHLRIRQETGARVSILLLALLTSGTTLVVFTSTTLADEPATLAALGGVIVVSVISDLIWKWIDRRRGDGTGAGHDSGGAHAPRDHLGAAAAAFSSSSTAVSMPRAKTSTSGSESQSAVRPNAIVPARLVHAIERPLRSPSGIDG
jgi:amino acid transporter